MPQQKRLTVNVTLKDLVPENPQRTGIFVQNRDSAKVAIIYSRKPAGFGGIFLYPHSWIKIEENEDPNLQWYIKAEVGTVGSLYVTVVEWFKEARPW